MFFRQYETDSIDFVCSALKTTALSQIVVFILQVHVSQSSLVPDHCRAFALSDPKDPAYQARCDHDHSEVCDRCNLLTETLLDIEAGLAAQTGNLSSDEREELSFRVKQGKTAIWAWKSHLLRSVNQDSARVELLRELDESSVLLVQDWAMKYLPRKYRESQTDWFAKRGIPWHVTVATRCEGEDVQMLTFVHIFQACSQDSCAVLAVMADVIRQLKITIPKLESVYHRQDNAGCYHCGATIVCARVIGEQYGVTIKRLDFSDPQGGKGPCDRKAATIKSHMRIHLNSGNDIETPTQMKDAILSSGGVSAVNVTVCESIAAPNMPSLKVEGVSLLNNIKYEDDGIHVWKAYGIGSGKLIKLQYPSVSELPTLTATQTHASTFTSVKPRRTNVPPHDKANDHQVDQDNLTDDNFTDPQEAIFACPEEGCTRMFLRHSSLQRHLDCGKHDRALERETLMDRASMAYAEKLEGHAPSVPEAVANTRPDSTLRIVKNLSMGWALKSSNARRSRFTASQKTYLTTKFKLGEQSGQKADPASVARAMVSAKDGSGNRLFTSDDFLSASQIAGFFSRLSAKKTLRDEVEEFEDDFQSAANEARIEELTNVAVHELPLGHPITYDVYNLCDMVARSKLKNFSVSFLKDICLFFNIDVTDISVHRKQPYMKKIQSLCLGCICQQ